MSHSSHPSHFRCPRCNGRAKFIRTRHFERGTADVYTCRNKKCTYYMLYFYNDHPMRLPRYPGRTYVMMRPGDPWHACNVTILPWTKSFLIDRSEYFDCYLPKRWRKIATAQQEETRPVLRSELW